MAGAKETKCMSDYKIGILGGGQLARMLALRGFELGAQIHIYSESSNDPAAQVTRFSHQGKTDSGSDLKAFLEEVNVATFESEFMDAPLLAKLSKETGTKIFPDPGLMGKIQDRLSQKEMLIKNKVPTTPYMEVSTVEDLEKAFEEFGPIVLKKRRFGYDGNGTFIAKDVKSLASVALMIDSEEHGWIAEKFIKFKRELACVIVRSRDGSIADLPLVETFQEDSRCLWVKGPVKTTARLTALGANLRKFLKNIDYVGAMGFEIFETEYDFFINELAPRVHNSGHYSLNALSEDQFSLHMKAVVGLKISSPLPLATGFAMYNLIGSSKNAPEWSEIPDGVSFHWYGKKENRPGRKMGHMNAVGLTPDAALTTLKIARRKFDV